MREIFYTNILRVADEYGVLVTLEPKHAKVETFPEVRLHMTVFF